MNPKTPDPLTPGLIGPPIPAPIGVNSVETYEILRMITGRQNQAIVVNCRTTPGDGGRGWFYWGPAAGDNDGTVITTDSGSGSWYRVYDGAINIQWFGVRAFDAIDNQPQAVANTAAINAMFAYYAALNEGPEFYAPAGIYHFTRPKVDDTKSIKFEGLTSAILRGAGKFATFFSYTAFPNETPKQKADYSTEGVFFSFRRCSYSRVQDICINGRDNLVVDGSALASMAAQITSDGTFSVGDGVLPFGDSFVNCYVVGYKDVGIQIGSRGVDRDVNLDVDSVESCVIDGSHLNGLPGGGQYGIRVSNSNTNNFLARHNLIQNYGTAGVELSYYPRATYLDGNLFACECVPPATADIIVRSAVSSFVVITDTIVELMDHPFIIQDRAGLRGPYSPADSTDDCSILIDGFQNSYSWAPHVVIPYKIFDIQGCGANDLANATISGPDDGNPGHVGLTAPVSFHPVPGSNAGPRRLTTRNVHFFNGAVWDVPNGWDHGTAQVRWIDLGSSRAKDVWGGDSTTPQLRLSDGMQVFAPGGFRTPFAAQAIPTDQLMLATKTRAYTFSYQQFVANAPTVDFPFETTPSLTRIVKVLVITRIPWAGVAGGITISIGNTGGGAAPGPDAYIPLHDVTGAAPIIMGRFPSELGAALTGPKAYIGGDILNFTPEAGGQLNFHLESTGAHLLGNGIATNLVAGSTTVYVTYEELVPTW